MKTTLLRILFLSTLLPIYAMAAQCYHTAGNAIAITADHLISMFLDPEERERAFCSLIEKGYFTYVRDDMVSTVFNRKRELTEKELKILDQEVFALQELLRQKKEDEQARLLEEKARIEKERALLQEEKKRLEEAIAAQEKLIRQQEEDNQKKLADKIAAEKADQNAAQLIAEEDREAEQEAKKQQEKARKNAAKKARKREQKNARREALQEQASNHAHNYSQQEPSPTTTTPEQSKDMLRITSENCEQISQELGSPPSSQSPTSDSSESFQRDDESPNNPQQQPLIENIPAPINPEAARESILSQRNEYMHNEQTAQEEAAYREAYEKAFMRQKELFSPYFSDLYDKQLAEHLANIRLLKRERDKIAQAICADVLLSREEVESKTDHLNREFKEYEEKLQRGYEMITKEQKDMVKTTFEQIHSQPMSEEEIHGSLSRALQNIQVCSNPIFQFQFNQQHTHQLRMLEHAAQEEQLHQQRLLDDRAQKDLAILRSRGLALKKQRELLEQRDREEQERQDAHAREGLAGLLAFGSTLKKTESTTQQKLLEQRTREKAENAKAVAMSIAEIKAKKDELAAQTAARQAPEVNRDLDNRFKGRLKKVFGGSQEEPEPLKQPKPRNSWESPESWRQPSQHRNITSRSRTPINPDHYFDNDFGRGGQTLSGFDNPNNGALTFFGHQ